MGVSISLRSTIAAANKKHVGAGSFLEVTKILPLLTRGSEQTFHVVAPSMPNCGFSQRTSKPGFGVPQYAEACHKLMLRLGYDKYGMQNPS
jgi:pimeloyl-ACP methyl ester carboxylesterase